MMCASRRTTTFDPTFDQSRNPYLPDSRAALNPTQARLYKRLTSVGPGPAAFFLDACQIVAEVGRGACKLETASHLVGHLLRDLESGVRQVLYAQLVTPPPTVTRDPAAGLIPDRPLGATDHSRSLRRAGSSASSDFRGEQKGKEDKHIGEIRAILAALGFAADSEECSRWCSLAGHGQTALHKLAHRDALNAPRPLDAAFAANFEAVVQLFDRVLDRFETRYATVYERLDVLLTRPMPSASDIKLLQQKIPNTPRTLGYFFERLTHPGWLEPLSRAGFFRSPPGPDFDPVRNTVGFPHWMAADYLTRIASAQPAEVTLILELLPNVENVRVQAQLIGVMLDLRPEDRVRLAPLVFQWAPHFARYQWGDGVSRFATALAQDGALDVAFRLAEIMLELPAPDIYGVRRPVQVAEYRGERERPEHLRDAAVTLVPALLEADAQRTLSLLADALDYHTGRCPEETGADPRTLEGLTDFSTLWADDLGESERIDASDLRIYLVHVVLVSTVSAGLRMPDHLSSMLSVLRVRGARVLRRIELAALTALLRVDDADVIAAALPLALERLTTRAIMIEADMDAEYGALLQATFQQLGADQRARVLEALEPPSFSWMENEDYRRSRASSWRCDRLALIREYLPDRERGELAELTETEGEPITLGRRLPNAVWTGPTSPLQDAGLRAMNPDQLVEFLLTWEPREGFAEASPEGLGRQLNRMVEEDPAKYAPWAPLFLSVQPTYMRSLLGGFAKAARADKVFPWNDILTLAAWVVNQPFPDDDMQDAERQTIDSDADWRPARRTIADLLGIALGRDRNEDGAVPEGEASRLWEMIANLADDPNPSTAYEARSGGTNTDPGTMAINTTRPEAIDAAIRFAYWRAQHRESSQKAEVALVIDAQPDIANLLDTHLDPERDGSLAVRAAIGRWLTSFARTDPDWVRRQGEALLPSAPDARDRRDALWDAFVQWAQPHPDALAVLEPFYRAAIERIGAPRETRRPEEADNRLAEHLIALYWWGAISLDVPDNLIAHLFTRGDTRRHIHAMRHIGYSLYHTPKPVPKEPIARLRCLWEWRAPQLAAFIANDHAGDVTAEANAARAELEQFGWWFASGAFEPTWALEELAKVVDIAGGIEIEHAVAEKLAELAPIYPALTVRCLMAIDYSGGSEPWSVHSLLEQLPTVIRACLASSDPDAKRMAREVVNRVVAAGHHEHRDLLAEATNE